MEKKTNGLKVIQMKREDLVPYSNNPRNNDDGVEAVANSIREFGFQQPIVVDEDNVIIVGHTRLKAAEALGLETVPVVVAHLTKEQAKAYRIADNKVADKSTWNLDALSLELKDLADSFDMTDFGFGNFELSMLTEDMAPGSYDDELINEYAADADEFLKAERVIITYKDEREKEWLEKILGVHNLKVQYSVEELTRAE